VPVKISRVSRGRYAVSTPSGTKAKGTTKKKAESQRRLLNAVEDDSTFKPRKKKRS
jgi:hypothetical protein